MRPLRFAFLALAFAFAARARAAEPLKVVALSGSKEYKSHESLEKFARFAEYAYNIKMTILKAPNEKETTLPGLEALDSCDVALFFTRRLVLPEDQLARIKKYCESGKPIVGVRTASHGLQQWLEFDKEYLGGSYDNHLGNDFTTCVTFAKDASEHPIMKAILPFQSFGSLYKNATVAKDATILLKGKTPQAEFPVAWTRERNGQRIFYTSIGAIGDFDNYTYRRLLANALYWAAKREPQIAPVPELDPNIPKPEGTLKVAVRTRVNKPGTGEFEEKIVQKELPIAETAILICDMWDKHWCKGATDRVGKIVEKMNPVLVAAREAGVWIIHAPSETMAVYADWPQRLQVQKAPKANKPPPLPRLPEPPLPIDDSDGGCDTDDTPQYTAWMAEHPGLEWGEYDAVSDNGDEIYNFCVQKGIKNILYCGVHTNMCVLGRSFAIRAMTHRRMNCFLLRDLTDTMYDPKDQPNVPHDKGTELVVEHIEKYWCPSLTSAELMKALGK